MGFGVWSHVEFSQPSQNSVLRWQHGRSYFHRHIQRLVWTKNGLYDGHYDLDRRHHYRIFRRKSLSLDGHSILCWSLVTCLPYCSRGFQVKRFHVYLQPPSSSEVYWERRVEENSVHNIHLLFRQNFVNGRDEINKYQIFRENTLQFQSNENKE